MIQYVTGNLFDSKAQAIVNTVNCEGYMGKGIAYQFKMAYPENNISYKIACKNGNLKIGSIHSFLEKGKIIINFPTKDKWRAKSKMEYIEKGLEALVMFLKIEKITSIAIPPLGSGNGGLIWADVKVVIEDKLANISQCIDVYIYEPSNNYIALPAVEPQLSLASLVLMQMKINLHKFNSTRLQKTGYIMDVIAPEKYFKFTKHKYGPYDHAIDVIAKNIKAFQNYHNTTCTQDAYNIAYKKLISESVDTKLNALLPFIRNAADYVNHIASDKDLECITTVLYILQVNLGLDQKEIVVEFKKWSREKAERFSETEIHKGITYLYDTGMIEKTLMGFIISNKRV